MSDDKVKFETIYGFSSANPEMHAALVIPGPRNLLEAAWWVVQGIFYEIVIPAALFALSVTAFAWGFRLI